MKKCYKKMLDGTLWEIPGISLSEEEYEKYKRFFTPCEDGLIMSEEPTEEEIQLILGQNEIDNQV